MLKTKHLIVYAAVMLTKKPFRWMIIILEPFYHMTVL